MNSSLTSPSLLSFGEVLWDVLPSGEHIGGAPFNLAAHAARCGMQASILSKVGCDKRGSKTLNELRRLGVDTTWVQNDPQHPTGWVEVELHGGQPSYKITRNVAWDFIEIPESLDSILQQPFSALACGTLAQRSAASRETLTLLRKKLPHVPVFYDVNLRGDETPLELVVATLPGVRWIKLNEDEASTLSQYIFHQKLSSLELATAFASQFGIQTLILTMGAKGCEIWHEKTLLKIEPKPVKLVSAIGAGDSFSAAFLSGILRGFPTEKAAGNASRLAEWVVSQTGAIPDYPQELQNLLI